MMYLYKCTAGKEMDICVEVYSWEGECCLYRSVRLGRKKNDVSIEVYSLEGE
jgi:hypothetical protein